MIHNIRLIKKEQQQTSRWAGGTTTQLVIYPEDAGYTDRSFQWRLSTARVELEESAFTSLHGFDRILMVLEGELTVVHEGQHTAHLKQYGQDSFKGGWSTVSYGKARDFNLMMKEGLTGSLKHCRISPAESLAVRHDAGKDEKSFFACYCYKGRLEASVDDRIIAIEEGELLLITYTQRTDFIIRGCHEQVSDAIIVQVENK
ncbi:MAG: hypothetical protein K0R84_1967 [Clostridia bacterium]|nr:hypothetical protein [Clostridia bacterium]